MEATRLLVLLSGFFGFLVPYAKSLLDPVSPQGKRESE